MGSAAAIAVVLWPPNISTVPISATCRSRWRTSSAAGTIQTSANSSPHLPGNLAGKPSFLTRCSPPENHLTSDTLFPAATVRPPGLIFPAGPTGSWDAGAIGSPVVNRYISDNKEQWLMWYHGSADAAGGGGGDSVGLAISNNGIHWERGTGAAVDSDGAGRVLQPGTDWWAFDIHSVRPAQTLIMSSNKLKSSSAVYWMYYTGIAADDGAKPLPGLAMSQDGRHWARIEGEHHSGALFDSGDDGEWDSNYIAAPKVVYHSSGDLRMYYHSFDRVTNRFVAGMARSRDGINWVKLGKVMGGGGVGEFDEGGVRNVHVVRRRRGGYVMAYEGVGSDGATSIEVAESEDGLKGWRQSREAVLVAEGGWDEGGVGEPCLVEMDGGEWRLYYRGVGDGGRSGIGLAVSSGEELKGFERWKGWNLL